MNHLIEHIEAIHPFMEEVQRILHPEGSVYIRTPDIKKVGFVFYDDFTHIRPFSPMGLNHLMSCYGFQKEYEQHSNSSLLQIDNLFHGRLISKRLPMGKEIEAVYIKKA